MMSYDYKCTTAGCALENEVQTIQKKISDPHGKCKSCDQEMVRYFSSGSFQNRIQLKGDGWTGSNMTTK